MIHEISTSWKKKRYMADPLLKFQSSNTLHKLKIIKISFSFFYLFLKFMRVLIINFITTHKMLKCRKKIVKNSKRRINQIN